MENDQLTNGCSPKLSGSLCSLLTSKCSECGYWRCRGLVSTGLYWHEAALLALSLLTTDDAAAPRPSILRIQRIFSNQISSVMMILASIKQFFSCCK